MVFIFYSVISNLKMNSLIIFVALKQRNEKKAEANI